MNVVVQCLAEATRWQHCTKYRDESFFMSGLQVTWSEVGEVIFRKCCTESEKLNTTHYIFFFHLLQRYNYFFSFSFTSDFTFKPAFFFRFRNISSHVLDSIKAYTLVLTLPLCSYQGHCILLESCLHI